MRIFSYIGWMVLYCVLAMSRTAIAADEVFHVSEIKPGLHGKTRTVMQGTKIIELDTEILGVQKDGIAPGRDLIIGKLVDVQTALTGAVHGMSGSPLYIGEKLVGALSRRIGVFEKDGHCGFTPIEDMLDVANRPASVEEKANVALSPMRFGPMFAKAGSTPSSLFSIPMTITGWREEWKPLFEKLFGYNTSWLPVAGGGGGVEKEASAYPLEPGSPLAAVMISGDVTVAGTGTLTWMNGNRIAGFGHPMNGLGDVNVPFASAEIITVVPSYLMPYKLSNTGRMAGTMQQDRLSAVAGVLGPLPRMASYEIHRTHGKETRPTWRGSFVPDPNMAPGLITMLFLSALNDGQDASENFTVTLSGQVQFKDLPPLNIYAVYSGTQAQRLDAITEQVTLLNQLYEVFPRQLNVESLSLDIKTLEEASVWKLQNVLPSQKTWRPGETVKLSLTLRNLKGEEREVVQEIKLPEEIKEGCVMLRVSSGREMIQREFEKINTEGNPKPKEVIDVINRNYSREALYLQVVTDTQGYAVYSKEQMLLPLSVLSVLQRGGEKSYLTAMNEKIWDSFPINCPGVVLGEKIVELEVKP